MGPSFFHAKGCRTPGHLLIERAKCDVVCACARCCSERRPVDEYPATRMERGGYPYLSKADLLVGLLGNRHVGAGLCLQGANMHF